MSKNFVEYVHKLPWVTSFAVPNDDTHSDRLNHRYTVGFLLACFFVVTSSVFVSRSEKDFSAITCWVPAQFKSDGYQTYINNYCWVSGTYYIPSNVSLPHSEIDRERATIRYYQWTPFILLCIAMCFYLPRMLWRSMNTRSGLNLQYVISRNNANELVREIEHYCQHNEHHASYVSHFFRTLSCTSGKRLGNYLRSIQVMVKFLYLINSFAQLVLINIFLGQSGLLYGLSIWHSIFVANSVLTDSPYFPRVTLCDLRIRELGILHRYSVQCVLPINMLNEKIFGIAWFWFICVFVYNLCSFISVLIDTLLLTSRIKLIQRLHQISGAPTINEESLSEFTRDFLMQDGILVIRLLIENEQDIVATEVVQCLLANYKQRQRQKRRDLESNLKETHLGDSDV